MRALLSALLLATTLLGCTADGADQGGGADLAGQDAKGDAVPGIEVLARLRPGTVDTRLTTSVPRPGFIFYAAEGAKVSLEVTHAGTAGGLDTLLKVYGPRLSDGSYPKTIATDDDSGYGKLSRIRDLPIEIGGFYLVEVTTGPAAAAPADDARLRIALACTGACDTDQPVAPIGLDVTWFQRAAERRALSVQAYATATARVEAQVASGAPANWGVVLDIDETSLDNSAYQRARNELGLGYSPASWRTWVDAEAATAIPGAVAFTRRVRALGGRVIFVSNRKAATECPQTAINLDAVGYAYDAILCRAPGTPSDKNPRFDQVRTGTGTGLPPIDVLAYVGDNILDFPAMSQDVRKDPEDALADFGERFFLVPNPMYGSWTHNLD